MKFIFIILLYLFSTSIYANEEGENEVEVINLHESKSLDQMVLENLEEGDVVTHAFHGKPGGNLMEDSKSLDAMNASLELKAGFQSFMISGDYEQKTMNFSKASRMLDWKPQARPIN